MLYLYPILIRFTFCFLSVKYSSEKRNDKWKTLYPWLQSSDERKIVCRFVLHRKTESVQCQFSILSLFLEVQISRHLLQQIMTQADVITNQFVEKNIMKLLQLEDPCHPERLCNMLPQTRQLCKVFNL